MDEAVRASTGTEPPLARPIPSGSTNSATPRDGTGHVRVLELRQSFTIISILSGCLTLFGFGMNVGGPASIA